MASDVADRADLLELCVQDLGEAARLAARRLPPIAECAGDDLRGLIERIAAAHGSEVNRFAEAEMPVSGPPNIWAGGILDDAQRDSETLPEGALRDIALVGAVRKLMAADLVSLETALALADRLERTELRQALAAMCAAARGFDRELQDMLDTLA